MDIAVGVTPERCGLAVGREVPALLHVGQRCRPGLMLVDDTAAEARAALAVELGLTCAETWWHRDLPGPLSDSRDEGPLRVRGARGRLVMAPLLYAPGGPVLLVTEFRDRPALSRIEREAARRGAAVSVVTPVPEEDVLGYRRTCDFYEGTIR